jgi:arginase
MEQGDFAVTLGGDHSIALGSVSAALEKGKDDLAVLWIDAHADINSPSTSPSGNLHGMPLAALMGVPSGTNGLRNDQWNRLLTEVVPKHRLSPSRIAWLGLRDVDDGERQALRTMDAGYLASMHDIDRFGVVEMMARLDRWLIDSGAKQLWVSFDVDCLDPVLAPGTGTAVRGGFSYREAHLFAELIRESLDAIDCPYRLVGLDVVETNPVLDSHNTTAVTAVEWTASLFGKTILGRR